MHKMDINKLLDVKYRFLSVILLPPVDKILDIGASQGFFSDIYPHTAEITSIDKQNSENNYFALSKFKFDKYEELNAWELDGFSDDYFDMVIFNEVIEHLTLEEIEKTMKQIKRVLKPEGLLQVGTPNKKVRKALGKYMANEYHIHEFEYKDITDIFKKHNFEILKEEGLLEYKEGKVIKINFRHEDPKNSYVMWFLLSNTKGKTKNDKN